MKVWKKLSAVALALVMVMALCVPAFAGSNDPVKVAQGDMTNENGVLGEFSAEGKVANIYTGKTILLYKEITAYNKDTTDGTKVKAPTIQYNYAIAAGTASASGAEVKITDEFGIPVEVKAGITTGATISGAVKKDNSNAWTFETGKLAFTPADVELDASANGTTNAFPIKVDFSNVAFTGAGVYRYIITETVQGSNDSTTDENVKNAAGIADGTISNVRYLDVYVKDADGAASATTGTNKYEIYGFVCFQNLQTPDTIDGTVTTSGEATTPSDNNNLQKVAKTEGFVAGTGWDSTSNQATTLTADSYYTFNVEIKKTLVNDQAMIDDDFPFNVSFTNSSVTVDVQIMKKAVEMPSSGTAGTPSNSTLTAGALSSITDAPQIDDGSTVKYIGIPVGITGATTVTVYETNDVVGTTYTSVYKINNGDASGSKTITWTSTDNANKSNEATITVTAINSLTGDATYADAQTVEFINTLMNISPTGVTLRYAPYMAMMGLGVVALPLSLRKKEELD